MGHPLDGVPVAALVKRRSHILTSSLDLKALRAAISTSANSSSRGFLKGARVFVRVDEPLDRTSRRLRDPSEHPRAGSVLGLLELDEVLPGNATHELTKRVVREACVLPGPLNPPCDQESRCEADPLLKFPSLDGHASQLYTT